MLKLVLVILAALMVCLLIAKYAGASWMQSTAFNVPHFGWAVSCGLVCFLGALALGWKIVKG